MPERSRSIPAVSRRVGLLVALAGLAGCGRLAPPPAAPPIPKEELAVSLFLIGDAGAPYPDDPVLVELTKQAADSPEGSVIAYLGDNLYPRGLPDSSNMVLRKEMERRLDGQLAVSRNSKRTAYFVPGNHDWARMGADGWNAVRRSQLFIRTYGGGFAEQIPADGCPGPEVIDSLVGLRLVFIDTQWWLHGPLPKPRGAEGFCRAAEEGEFRNQLISAVKDAGDRAVIVMGHHPLATGGEHGGRFTIWDHLFPLREVKKWFWFPFPLVGSIYPFARSSGVSDQDISGSENKRLRAVIEDALKEGPALLYAAGHDHNLQVFRGPGAEFTVVSGSGYFGHTTQVGSLRQTVYRAQESGFMRVDLTRAGSIRLSVTVVGPQGTREPFAVWLKEPPKETPKENPED